jgi:PAS domain S-box-containing protein
VHRILLPGGTEKLVHERAEIVRDIKSGIPLKMIGTIQDITDREKNKKRLEKANNELKTLFQNIQEAVFSVDMETYQVIQMSAASEKVYGYLPEDFINNPALWLDVILEEDKQVIHDNDPKLRSGQPILNEYRIHDKQGNIRWLETKIDPTLNAEGTLIRIDGITTDITQRKKAEIALKESEYKFRFLIENSSDAIVIINERHEVIFASNSVYHVTGYKPDEVVGLPSIEAVHPEDQPVLQQLFSKLLQTPYSSVNMSYRRLRKDGSYIWCNGTATNLLHEPVVKGVVINFRNITEQKEYEEALKRSNEDLKKTNMELDRFVYSVSHDLRAPLSSMLGVISFLETEATDTQMLKDIGFLKSNVIKQDNFILDILDYSRNARLDLDKEMIDFKELLDDTVKHLKFMSSGNDKIDIRLLVDDKIPFYSDKTRLNIVFNNLISNAIRYSNPQCSDPFVEISINLHDAYAEIIVRDNGLGIAKEHHEKIFEIFYRVSKKSVGSGLGLYIVKETVEKLHGTIRLESEEGKGTAFYVSVPNLFEN